MENVALFTHWGKA